jgi:ribose transport system permease protein
MKLWPRTLSLRLALMFALVGVLLLGVMSNGLNILQVNSYLQLVLTGGIILLAVLLSGLARRE